MTDEATGGKPLSWIMRVLSQTNITIPTAALTELLAAAEECADGTTQMVWDKFGRMVPYPDRAADAERALTPVRRLRAAVARVRGE